MPIHDWTRVADGTWHDFHLAWIAEIRRRLNGGILPPDHYALAEQLVGRLGPDVQALHAAEPEPPEAAGSDGEPGGIAVAVAPPRPKLVAEAYLSRRRAIVVRHSSDDRIVAMIELVSPGNKSNHNRFRSFVEKAAEALSLGYHLLVIDLFPRTTRDPDGIHAAIWREFGEKIASAPDGPLTLVAYSCGQTVRAYLEPTAVGRDLIEMPLFLTGETYVNVPLEETYRAAWEGVPRKWRAVLEATP